MATFRLLLLVVLVGVARAQTTQDLIGGWQAQLGIVSSLHWINADGTHTFTIAAQNYSEDHTSSRLSN